MKREIWKLALVPLVLLVIAASCYALRPQPRTLHIGIFAGSPWGVPGGNLYGLLDESIARFEKEHPGVQVTYTSGISRDDYSEWLAGKFLAGKEPDVFLLLPQDLPLYAAQGALLHLAPLEQQDAAFSADAFYPAAFAYGLHEGESYALPVECMTTLMFVNKSILAREGIPVPPPDWTLDAFYDIAAQTTRDADGDGALDQFGAYAYGWQLALGAYGAELFRADGRASHFAAPEVESAVRFCIRLQALTHGQAVTPRDFDLGRVVFRPFSFAEYRTYKPYPWRIKKYANFEWDCIPLPKGADAGRAPMGVLLMGISARTHEQALAWEFLRDAATSDAGQRALLTYSQGLPVKRGVLESSRPEDVFGEDAATSLTPALLGEVLETAATAPNFARYDGAMLLADTKMQSILAGTTPFDNAMNRLQKEINAYLQR